MIVCNDNDDGNDSGCAGDDVDVDENDAGDDDGYIIYIN